MSQTNTPYEVSAHLFTFDVRAMVLHIVNRNGGDLSSFSIPLISEQILAIQYNPAGEEQHLDISLQENTAPWDHVEELLVLDINQAKSAGWVGMDVLDVQDRLVIGGLGITVIESTDPIASKLFKFAPGQEVGVGLKEEGGKRTLLVHWNNAAL